ncbi:MAG: UDP-N-acetylmuramoylalanyl-D-glutamyl-2,6-diaminopimelate--D-alanyl-D-alanine ligase [Anderseniella sp.]
MAEQPLWTIAEVIDATGGHLEGKVEQALNGVAIDSRAINAGDIFVAIKGERTDGHEYAANALKAGAAVAIVSRPDSVMREAGPVLVVDDALAALEALGRAARSRSRAHVIAVTGSVGKTTTKDALNMALSACGETHASVSSFNNQWGVPLTLARFSRTAQFGVFEVGMNHAGEIETLIDMVRPHTAIVTAIAESHLGHFASLSDIARAKAEIFTGVVAGGVAIINHDTEFFDLLRDAAREQGIADIRSFGEQDGSDILLKRANLHDTCSCVTAEVRAHEVTYKLGAPGRHVVLNSLAVLAACEAAGADLAICALALARIAPPSGRGVRHSLNADGFEVTVIDESYNANPASMRAALEMLGASQPSGRGRRLAVLGDMLELGEHSDRLHLELADPLQAAEVDQVFACGPAMNALWQKLPAAVRGAYAPSSQDLIVPLLEAIQANDVIMIKGSLGSRMAPVVDAIINQYGGTSGA